jgi:hypothetical protein
MPDSEAQLPRRGCRGKVGGDSAVAAGPASSPLAVVGNVVSKEYLVSGPLSFVSLLQLGADVDSM